MKNKNKNSRDHVLHLGDNLKSIANYADNSIHAVIIDGPYFHGLAKPSWIASLVAVQLESQVFLKVASSSAWKSALTNTQVGGNEVLDIELIIPLPLITSLRDRWAWRSLNWGCSGMACEGEWMREEGVSLIYDFTTYERPPLGFISNIYLISKIKRVHLTYIQEDKFIYLNDDLDGPCKKPNCSHNQCDIRMLEWTAEYDWSKRPHPLLEVDKTLRWIKRNFPQTTKREVAQIYHKLVSTGMRNGELIALTHDKVDLDNRKILVSCTWNKKDGFKDLTKSGEDRIIEIAPPLLMILKELKLKNSDSVFVLPRIQEWDDGRQAEMLRYFLIGIGLPQIRFHDLRASWATVMLGRGIEPVKVMAMGGWKDLKTMMIYIRKAGISIQGITDTLDLHDPFVETGRVLSLKS